MLENMHEQMEASDVEALEIKKKQKVTEEGELAKKWANRIESARRHYEKHHKRFKYNRKLVEGFDYSKEPDSPDFYKHRANLIYGSIEAILPNIYARNPEISAIPTHKSKDFKKFCETVEMVTNTHLEKAELKDRAKNAIRSALTCSIGVLKVIYQRDITEDPIIKSRIEDAQDDIQNVERLMMEIEDETSNTELNAKKEEYQNTIKALSEQLEVVSSEGIVIDGMFPEYLIIDPSVTEFFDYEQAEWMCQVIPMKKTRAEGVFKKNLDKAKIYSEGSRTSDSYISQESKEDEQIAILEIWDKTTHSVYTMADGCNFWLREPYSPEKVGQRWYPFFLLPYQTVYGHLIGPSLVDLTEKMQAEHNKTRDRYNNHRDLCMPGYVVNAAEVSRKDIKTFSQAGFGEILEITPGNNGSIKDVFSPKIYPQIDPMVYDTGGIRQDWEMVTGLQDASRSVVVEEKTATEASIMQQALSGRVGAFRDQVEDWIKDIAQYSAQILVQELTPAQVERIMGPPIKESVYVDGVEKAVFVPSFDWPQMRSKEEVFGMVAMKIRAGTTGAPDKMEQQEAWQKLLPIIQNLIQMIAQAQMSGMNADPVINLLKETIKRFDDRLDPEPFIPKPQIQNLEQGMIDPGQPQNPQEQQIPEQPMPDQFMPEQQTEELMLPEQYQ